jgi:hypothetical protein
MTSIMQPVHLAPNSRHAAGSWSFFLHAIKASLGLTHFACGSQEAGVEVQGLGLGARGSVWGSGFGVRGSGFEV